MGSKLVNYVGVKMAVSKGYLAVKFSRNKSIRFEVLGYE